MHRTEGLDGGAQWKGGGTTAAVRLRTQCIHTLRVCHTLKGVYKCMGMHIFNMQVSSELLKLVVNLMHKVALSPHLISVWIKMDYWIT